MRLQIIVGISLWGLSMLNAGETRNLYLMLDSSEAGQFHFAFKETLKGKILIDDRSNQMEDRPRFSFWADSSEMGKIPRNADDHRYPWFEIGNAGKIKAEILKRKPNLGLECAAIDATIEVRNYAYTGIQHTEVSDAAEIKLLRISKVDSGVCELDLRWWSEVIKKKDAWQYKK